MTKRKSSNQTQARASTPARGASAKVRVSDVPAEPPQIPAAEASPAPRSTKQALILGLLQRPEGASLADLVAATGWLPHTTRAALTRLRQAGHVLDKITARRVPSTASPPPARRSAPQGGLMEVSDPQAAAVANEIAHLRGLDLEGCGRAGAA